MTGKNQTTLAVLGLLGLALLMGCAPKAGEAPGGKMAPTPDYQDVDEPVDIYRNDQSIAAEEERTHSKARDIMAVEEEIEEIKKSTESSE